MTDNIETLILTAVDRTLRTQYIPGGVVCVVAPGAQAPLVKVMPFGLADVRRGEPVTTTTSFEIGSVSKVFAGTVLAWAIGNGAPGIGLDAPLQDFAPVRVPRLGDAAITLGHLVTHRSGLPRMPMHAARTTAERAGYSTGELWAALERAQLVYPTGSSWLYSNFGFGLLGTALSQALGRSLVELIDESVCQPLGMTATAMEPSPTPQHWWQHSAPPPTGLATGYWTGSTANRPIVAPQWDNTGAMAGAGGLVSTGDDMARFLAAAVGYGSTPATEVLARTRQPIAPAGKEGSQMGMAWQIRRAASPSPIWFKNGGTSGMHCAIAVRPGRAGVVVLTNGPDHVDSVAVGLLKSVLPREQRDQ